MLSYGGFGGAPYSLGLTIHCAHQDCGHPGHWRSVVLDKPRSLLLVHGPDEAVLRFANNDNDAVVGTDNHKDKR